MQIITGRCYCGEINYRIESNILKSGVCYCCECQSLTGGPAWPFITVPQNSLFVEGRTKEFTRQGGTGKPVHISFCPICGLKLFCEAEVYSDYSTKLGWPPIKSVSANSLDDKTVFIPDMYVWTEHAPKWILFDPNIIKFERGPSKLTD